MLPVSLEGALDLSHKVSLQHLDPQYPLTEERETTEVWRLQNCSKEQNILKCILCGNHPDKLRLRLHLSGSAAKGIGCPHRERPSVPSNHMVG